MFLFNILKALLVYDPVKVICIKKKEAILNDKSRGSQLVERSRE